MLDLSIRLALAAGGAAVVLAGAAWFAQHERGIGDTRGAARVQAAWDKASGIQAAQAIKDLEASAAETKRRLTAQKEITDATTAQLAKARTDLGAARAAGQRVLDAQRAYIAAALGGASLDPTAAGIGATAGSALDVLAELRGGADNAAGELAAALDAAYLAGRTCERSYASLTP
jgi:hypothetical protein